MCKRSQSMFSVLSLALLLALSATAVAAPAKAKKEVKMTPSGEYVMELANSYKGGEYIWKGGTTGVPFDLVHKGTLILKKQPKGTFCCGFTLAMAFQVAQDFQLFDDFTPKQIKQFQSDWYGNTKQTAERQGAIAIERLKIGHQVKKWSKVKAGDFCNYWRKTTKGSSGGHSVIFVEWIKEKKRIVGFKYRSSQGSTKGIGNRIEYFYGVKKDDAGKNKRGIDRKRLYFYRFFTPKEATKIAHAKQVFKARRAEKNAKIAKK